MADERLRSLERLAAAGGAAEVAALARERVRLGMHRPGECRVLEVGFVADRAEFLPSGRVFVEVSTPLDHEPTLRILDAATGEEVARVGRRRTIRSALSPDRSRVAAAPVADPVPNDLAVWQLDGTECWRADLGGYACGIAWSPRGDCLLVSGGDRQLRVFDAADGRLLSCWPGAARQRDEVLLWLPDGKHALSAMGDRDVRIWDMDTQRCVGLLSGHEKRVEAMAVAPNGSIVVTGSADGTARVWDLQARREVHCLRAHKKAIRTVAVSPTVRRALTAGGDGTIRVWDLPTGREAMVLRGHEGFGRGLPPWVTTVAYSPDGLSAISSALDQTIRIWSLPI